MNRKIYASTFLLLLIACLAANGKNKMVYNNQYFSDTLSKRNIVVEPARTAVKLYPNPSWNGTVTIQSNNSEPLHFYVFDLEGVMIHQVVLKGKAKHTINNLKKGLYLYDAFLNDISIEHGQIVVK